jgi:multidrug efflux pump subunit AcrA (membrane-fusion protein)
MEGLNIAQMLAQAQTQQRAEEQGELLDDVDALEQSQEALDFAADVRQATLDNTDTVEVLAQKARDAQPGQSGDKARTLFGTTWWVLKFGMITLLLCKIQCIN